LSIANEPVRFAEPRLRVSEFSALQIAVLLCALLLVATIPVWTHPLPPLADYVNHLARMHVIATIDHDPTLSRYYEIEWQIIPNLMMDLIVPTVAGVVGVYLAGQLFTAVCLIGIVTGALALNRSLFGRWSAGPLMTIPLLYNGVFLVGVMNYMFGIGLCLWALAAWVRLRNQHLLISLSVSTVFCIALFFCHLFALGLYGLGVCSYEIWRYLAEPQRPRLGRQLQIIVAGIPFLLVLSLLLFSPTMQLAGEIDWEPRGKLDGLIYVIEVYSDIAAIFIGGSLAMACIWAVRYRLLRVHPFGWTLLVVACAVYLAMPRTLFASYMADQRLPIAIAFTMIAAVDVSLRNRQARRGFVAILLVLLAVRVIEVDVVWAQLSVGTRELRQSVRRMKSGAKVLVAYSEQSGGGDVRDWALVHAACVAMIERSALVTTAFTVRGKQIIHARPPYEDIVDAEDGTPPSIAQLVIAAKHPPREDENAYWNSWGADFDYVFVLFTADDAPNPDAEHLALVYQGDRFQLYSVIRGK
jgi:hypothetical protein